MTTNTTSTTVASASASTVVVDGLAELAVELTKAEKLDRIKVLQAAKAGKARAEKKRDERVAKLIDLRDGSNEEGKNGKYHRNAGLFPETLRPSFTDELINGSPAKGWVVTVRCQHLVTVPELDDDGKETGETVQAICGDDRLINTQDAFQTRFCEDHKAEAGKAASKARRAAKKDAELLKMSEADLDAELAKLEKQAA